MWILAEADSRDWWSTLAFDYDEEVKAAVVLLVEELVGACRVTSDKG